MLSYPAFVTGCFMERAAVHQSAFQGQVAKVRGRAACWQFDDCSDMLRCNCPAYTNNAGGPAGMSRGRSVRFRIASANGSLPPNAITATSSSRSTRTLSEPSSRSPGPLHAAVLRVQHIRGGRSSVRPFISYPYFRAATRFSMTFDPEMPSSGYSSFDQNFCIWLQ
jgi:hypothetical protein